MTAGATSAQWKGQRILHTAVLFCVIYSAQKVSTATLQYVYMYIYVFSLTSLVSSLVLFLFFYKILRYLPLKSLSPPQYNEVTVKGSSSIGVFFQAVY